MLDHLAGVARRRRRKLYRELCVDLLARGCGTPEVSVRSLGRRLPREPLSGRAGGVGLQVARAGARALTGWPVEVDGHVAELAGAPCETAVKLSVQDQPTADAGAERQHQHVVAPAPRPEHVLGHGSGVRVVLDRHRQPDPFGDPVAQVDPFERDVHRGLRTARALVDQRRESQSDADHVVAHELLDGDLDLGQHRVLVRGVGGPDLPFDDYALTVDQPGEELRPAEVHPDDVLVCHLVNRIGAPGPRLP